MNRKKTGRSCLQIIVYILYFSAGAKLGYEVAAALMQNRQEAIPTLLFVLCILAAMILQKLLHVAGHYCLGRISGLRVIAFTFFHRTYVKEGEKFRSCAPFPESALTSCLMAPRSRQAVSYTAYLLGGALFNLLSALAALVLLLAVSWSLGQWQGCLCFSVFLTGIWAFMFTALPAYHAGIPSDGLQVFQIKKNTAEKEALQKNLWILAQFSKAKPILEEGLDLDLKKQRKGKIFSALLLLRCYELALWQGQIERAGQNLFSLYQRLSDLPDLLQQRVWMECIFYLSLPGSLDQDLELTQRLMNRDRIKRYEELASPESLRCLWVWALYAKRSLELAGVYEEAAFSAVNQIAFHPAVQGWKKVLADVSQYNDQTQ